MTDTRSRITQAIDEAVAAALPQLDRVDHDAALTSDVGLDSVQIMDLVMEIEDRLDISVPIDILAEVQTLSELAERLQPLVEERA